MSSSPDTVVLGSGRASPVRHLGLRRSGLRGLALGSIALNRLPRFTDPASEAAPGTLTAPMPGMVTEVLVAIGDKVEAGQPLLRLEAMKMQHTVQAPTAGTVSELSVAKGQQVEAGAPLVTVSEES